MANGKSLRKSSLDWSIPRGTLQHKVLGILPKKEAYTHLQRLAPIQEQRLTDWVLVQESLRLNPTYAQIKAFTSRILASRRDAAPLGKRWMAGFLRRNPVLKTKKQFKIDSVRVNSATSDIIKAWFQKLEIPAIKAIKVENRWNMDKAGIIKGQRENRLVVGSTKKRFI